jgi:hypothetical protein
VRSLAAYSVVVLLLLSASCSGSGANQQVPATPTAGILGDTWTWDGRSWHLVQGASPPARTGAVFTYDVSKGQMLLFGGSGLGGLLDDTWTWDPSGWTARHPVHHPIARQDAGAVFDPSLSQVLMFGGVVQDKNEGKVTNETWTWDGSDWIQLQPANAPSPRSGPAMAYDAANNVITLFGGNLANVQYYDDTWTWDGKSWTQLSVQVRPPPRASAGIAFDSKTSALVLVGGEKMAPGGPGQVGLPLDDTWTWAQRRWSSVSPSPNPSARVAPAMASDVSGTRVLLFGGIMCPALSPDLWAWTDGVWSKLPTSSGPSARWGTAMALDPTHKNVVLFGGSSERTCFASS